MSAPIQANRYDQKYQGYSNFRTLCTQPQASVTKGIRGKPPCSKCGELYLCECRVGKVVCYACGQASHLSFECPKKRQGKGNGRA